jgi:hypothetical protein
MRSPLLTPRDLIASNRGVAAGIAECDKHLENRISVRRSRAARLSFSDSSASSRSRHGRIPRQRLVGTLVMEPGRIRSDDLPEFHGKKLFVP